MTSGGDHYMLPLQLVVVIYERTRHFRQSGMHACSPRQHTVPVAEVREAEQMK